MVVTPNAAAARACRYLARVAGDKQLSGYVRADATKLRDILVENGLAGSSVARLFTTVKSILNFACMEAGLEIKNPFAGLYLDRGQGVSTQADPRACDRQSASVLMTRFVGPQPSCLIRACA